MDDAHGGPGPALTDLDRLRAHLGPVSPLAAAKIRSRLDRHARHFIALSPFLVIASADAEGRLDASPRGDPPGFVQVLDDATLLLPDRRGNNLADTFGNLLTRPRVGLVFFVPGVEETLRVNGTARVTTDPALLAGCAVQGKPPVTGTLIGVEEAYFHCAKALRRARLWHPATPVERSSFPTLGRILAKAEVTVAPADVAGLQGILQAVTGGNASAPQPPDRPSPFAGKAAP